MKIFIEIGAPVSREIVINRQNYIRFYNISNLCGDYCIKGLFLKFLSLSIRKYNRTKKSINNIF